MAKCYAYNITFGGNMKKALIIIGIIIVAAVAFFVMLPDVGSPAAGTTQKRTFAAITKEVEQGAQLIDVRTPEEYAAGHFTGATNFNSVDIDAGKYPDTSKDATIYLYCRSGHRAGLALTALKQAGFTNVTSLGGLSDVQALGGKLVQ